VSFWQLKRPIAIYIHGAPDEATMGVPSSKGCIRLRNQDIIELFERVKIGEDVIRIISVSFWQLKRPIAAMNSSSLASQSGSSSQA
jgi:hypothetical protein